MRTSLHIKPRAAVLALWILLASPIGIHGQMLEPPPRLNDGWDTAAPGTVGLDAERLAALTAAIRGGEYGNVHAVLIERQGKLVYEEYFDGQDWSWGAELGQVRFGRASLHDLRSITKSVTATLVGIAIDRGEITSIDIPLHELLPKYAHLLTGEKRAIRLRHVLTMTAGLEWNEWTVPYSDPSNDEARLYESADPIAFVLARKLVAEPGTVHNYNGGLTQVLAAVVEQATGRGVVEFAREVLFRPLFIYDMVWRTEDGVTPVAAYGLRMRARDLAKLGSVYLNRGQWNGRRIISEAWVDEALRSHVLVDQVTYRPPFAVHVGYGYQWWHLRYVAASSVVEAPSAVGNGNQRIILVPDLELSVTVFSGEYNSPSAQVPWIPDRLVAEQILPAVQPQRVGDAVRH